MDCLLPPLLINFLVLVLVVVLLLLLPGTMSHMPPELLQHGRMSPAVGDSNGSCLCMLACGL
jgi:hypothetical protein